MIRRTAASRTAAALAIAFLTAAPFLYLVYGAVSAAFCGRLASCRFAVRLFFRTLALESGAALLSVILGGLVALGIWVYSKNNAGKFAVALLLLYIIPSFIHLQSWIFFMDRINALISAYLPVSPNFTGYSAAVLTTAISGLPLTAGLALFALLSVPEELAELCRIEASGAGAFLRVFMPYLVPSLFIGGFFVFFLNINDFAIPSLFGVNVFALEIFSRFSAGMDIFEVFTVSLPLIILCAALAAIFGFHLSKSNFSLSAVHGRNPFADERFLKIPARLGMVVLAFFVLVPLSSLISEAFSAGNIPAALIASSRELVYSLGISVLTAVLCFFPALFSACLFYRSRFRLPLIALASVPFVIPAPIAGLALIRMWNTPQLGFVYHSPVMPSIGMISRFTFIGMLMLTSVLTRLDPVYFDTLKVYYPGPARAAICVFRLIYKECAASMLIIFALALGEFGMTLLITPPGYQTLTNKIYNYLHYGASGTIAVLCLFLLILVLAAVMLAYALLNGKKE